MSATTDSDSCGNDKMVEIRDEKEKKGMKRKTPYSERKNVNIRLMLGMASLDPSLT